MKNLALSLVTMTAVCTASCQQNEPAAAPTGEKTITFHVVNYDQTPLDNSLTRAADATSLAHLALAVYDAATLKPATEAKIQDSGQTGYGSFSLTLPYGDYVIVFLGYDNNRTPNLSDPRNITFTDNYVPNLFCKSLNLKVDESAQGVQRVSLSRAVACFSLVCEDAMPATLNSLKYTIQGGSGSLNALTGYATEAQERTFTFANLTAWAGKSGMTVNLYTFLPSQETEMDFTITAQDAQGANLRTRTFKAVPMRINQRTRYTGSFFAADAAATQFVLELDNNVWTEENHNY